MTESAWKAVALRQRELEVRIATNDTLFCSTRVDVTRLVATQIGPPNDDLLLIVGCLVFRSFSDCFLDGLLIDFGPLWSIVC